MKNAYKPNEKINFAVITPTANAKTITGYMWGGTTLCNAEVEIETEFDVKVNSMTVRRLNKCDSDNLFTTIPYGFWFDPSENRTTYKVVFALTK